MENNKSANYFHKLRRGITRQFNLEEFELLVFEMEVNWDELPGKTISKKAHSFILQLSRQGRLEELILLLSKERPRHEWPSVPSPKQQIEDERANIPDSEREAAMQKYLNDW